MKVFLFVFIFLFLTLSNFSLASADSSTQIVAEVAPVRYVYLDNTQNIIAIESNTKSNISPIYLYYNNPNKQVIPENATRLAYRNIISKIDVNKTGVIYKKSHINIFVSKDILKIISVLRLLI